jgi:hypothetical protein
MMKMPPMAALLLSLIFSSLMKTTPMGISRSNPAKSSKMVKKWLYDARGKAVKVISYLLEFLPEDLSYDIIFMERDISEILALQQNVAEKGMKYPRSRILKWKLSFANICAL